jgi:hypothetical protein
VDLERVFDNLLNAMRKIVLEEFSAKGGKEGILNQTILNERLHEISNDNGVRVVNFGTSKKFHCQKYNVPTLQYS